MPLLDRQGPISEPWTPVADDNPIDGAAVIVSLARLKAEQRTIFAAGRRVGVDLASAADPAEIAELLPRVDLVAVRFASLKDGRPFSLGRLLRMRHGFRGELRAVGPFIPDQGQFLVRSGYTTFFVPDGFDTEAFFGALQWFPLAYQPSTDGGLTIAQLRHPARRDVADLTGRYSNIDAAAVVAAMIKTEFPGAIAVTSSFGAESAVLLHMVAAADPATPVIFLDTGKLFDLTHRYRAELTRALSLTNIVVARADSIAVTARDPTGTLWSTDSDACCAMRKVEPLARALAPFAAWLTGRKSYQAETRAQLALFERDQGRIKINPLARWSESDIEAYAQRLGLPRHPLVAEGYRSIGCAPCTTATAAGEDARAGRWRGSSKTECGIHGRLVQKAAS
jgi:phosphoadenylyl-sulfate reductase (thioredoxin)